MKSLIILFAMVSISMAEWPSPKSPAVPEADGYVAIPNVALPPAKEITYRAIFDATRSADKPAELLPALNMAGSELNALAAANLPLSNAKFAIVFHGPAVDGILDDTHYKAKFGASNPNLKAIAEMNEGAANVMEAPVKRVVKISFINDNQPAQAAQPGMVPVFVMPNLQPTQGGPYHVPLGRRLDDPVRLVALVAGDVELVERQRPPAAHRQGSEGLAVRRIVPTARRPTNRVRSVPTALRRALHD